MVSFLEMEFKYLAKNVRLEDFIRIMKPLKRKFKAEEIAGGSNDYYYSKETSIGDFFRYRAGNKPELTRKKRLRKKNSWARFENDLPLDPKRINKEIVDNLMKSEGYRFNFSIYKNFHIFKFKNLNFVFYSVYKLNGKYVDSFIEVEVNKENMQKGVPRKVYMKMLEGGEAVLAFLGITYENRLNEQLFDLYRRF